MINKKGGVFSTKAKSDNFKTVKKKYVGILCFVKFIKKKYIYPLYLFFAVLFNFCLPWALHKVFKSYVLSSNKEYNRLHILRLIKQNFNSRISKSLHHSKISDAVQISLLFIFEYLEYSLHTVLNFP